MRLRFVIVLLGSALLLPACADLSVLDPCEQFAQLVETRSQVQELDPATTTADEAREVADNLLDELEDFETAADGLYTIQIEDYRTAVEDVQLSIADVGGDATFDQWAPILADSLLVSARAFRQLQDVVEPACES
jgi:hypothetical protein